MRRSTEPTYFTERIAARIRARAAEGKITGTELAERVGTSQGHMSHLLRGQKVMDVQQLESICQALDLDIVEVVDTAFQETVQAGELDAIEPLMRTHGGDVVDLHSVNVNTMAAKTPHYNADQEAEASDTP